MSLLNLLTLVTSICVMLSVVELIRRGRLKEKYAILWLFAGAGLVALSLSRGLLERVSLAIGIYYPPSLLFVAAFGFLTLINLHYSTVISKLTEQNNRLAQEVGLLAAEVAKLTRACEGAGSARSEWEGAEAETREPGEKSSNEGRPS